MSWFSCYDILDPLPAAFLSSVCPLKRTTISSFLDPVLDEALLLEELAIQRSVDYAPEILAPVPPDVAFPYYHSSSPGLDLVHLARAERGGGIRALADRVAALEAAQGVGRDRKYKWTAEIGGEGKDGVDRKYKCVATAKADGQRDVKWTEEYRGRRNEAPSRTYSFHVSSALAGGKKADVKGKKKVGKNATGTTRVVEITDPKTDQGAAFIKKAFKKGTLSYSRGKRRELSLEDAALLIQMTFRAHLLRRSQVLRGLRDLAVAKAKLKEIRALFSNFSYRRCVASDAEQKQRFSEKIIVLLLTVDAIEGPDYMVRAAKKSMVAELEAMLEIIDPQGYGKLGSLKKRRFDLPEGSGMQKEMELGVAEVVQLLNQEEESTFA